MDRYARQVTLAQIGGDGQERLRGASVLLIGVGALGCVIADHLVRAGVGRLTFVDRDVVDLTNLHRQSLFTELDAERRAPKVEAAAARLAAVNSGVDVRPIAADLTPDSIARVLSVAERVDVIIDGTDNFSTRYLLNDVAVRDGVPLVLGGALGVSGSMLVTRPGDGPCLRCVHPAPPPAGSQGTCETVGVLGPVVGVVGSLQAIEAIRLIVGGEREPEAWMAQLWDGTQRRIDLRDARDPACPCCGQRSFEFLGGNVGQDAAEVCGSDAVRITPVGVGGAVDLAGLGRRLGALGEVDVSRFRVRVRLNAPTPEYVGEVVVFADGGAILYGTRDVAAARTAHARLVGS